MLMSKKTLKEFERFFLKEDKKNKNPAAKSTVPNNSVCSNGN
jgi:hypothetical protein